MNILILGGSSKLAKVLINQLINCNYNIILVSRNRNNFLELIAHNNVTIVYHDFCNSNIFLFNSIRVKKIDVLVNFSSLSTSTRDSESDHNDIRNIVFSDIANQVLLIENLINNYNCKQIYFISSFLSEIISLDRRIYSSTKIILEIFLYKTKCLIFL